MILDKISVQGLRSFNKEQQLDFTQLESDGFYYITGENLIEPNLGANGAGKSSLIEALTYLLYNKTSTNLVASNVANWDNPHIKVEALIDGLHIVRTWNPNTLTVDKQTVTQDQLESLIGLNFQSFLYSVFVSQFASKFFDLDPSDKMEIFSDIMEDSVQDWEEYSLFAKSQLEGVEALLSSKRSDLAYTEGKIKELTDTNYKQLEKEWEQTRNKKISELNIKITAQEKELDNLYDDKEKAENLLKEVKEPQALDDLANEYETLQDKIKDGQIKVSNLEQQIKEKEREIKSIPKDVCPTCKQDVTVDYTGSLSKQYKDVIDSYKESITQLLQKQKTLEESRNVILDKLKKVKQDNQVIIDERNTKQMNVQKINNSIVTLRNNIKTTKAELGMHTEQKNPYTELVETNVNKLSLLNKKLQYLKQELTDTANLQTKYKFWIKGFKDIRLLVIEEAIQDLEISINNNLSNLGMGNWSIKLKIDSVTKKGTIKKGFNIFVQSPKNNELVPFSLWSGGEGQRLRLAGTLGMIDFILNKKGIVSNIEVFDEPTQYLSDIGIEDLLLILRQRAKDLNKMVFIVDHRQFSSYGIFNGTIKIVKDISGSRIEM